MANKVLNSAEDLVLLFPSENRDNYIFAVKPDFATRRRHFEATVSDPNEKDLSAFSYWNIDETAQEVKGSSTFLGLRLDKKALRPEGLWVPGVLEARALDSRGKLSNVVYRDFGVAVYSNHGSNENLAKSLVERAEKESWELPLVVPFRSLDYSPSPLNPHATNGVVVNFVAKPKGLISGKEATDVLGKFNWKGNSGAQRLYRVDGGNWNANWVSLANSNAVGLVGDWVCGEAARADLEKAYASLDERQYGTQIRELQNARQTRRDQFTKELDGK